MQTIDLSELESGGHSAIREIQLAHIKECSQVNLQWIFKTNNLELVSAKFSQKNLGRTSVSLVMRAFQRLCALNHFRGWNPSKLVDFPRTSHCPDLEVARLLSERILTLAVIVMNGELCVGVGFLIKIESPRWKIQNYIS